MKLKFNNETIRYIIVGLSTTVINIIMFIILKQFIEVNIANIIAITISIFFAFFMNKNYVFESKHKNMLQLIFLFFGSRSISMLVEIVLVYFFVTLLQFNSLLVKILVNIVVIILNYLFSKKIFMK